MKAFFGFTQTQSSAYYRMIGFAKKMKKLGLVEEYFSPEWNPEKFDSFVNTFEEDLSIPKKVPEIAAKLDFLNEKKNVDIWVMQLFCSCHGLALMDVIHKHYKKPVITEVDDWAFGIDASNPNAHLYTPGSDALKIIKAQLNDSDALIVSTNYLKELYKPFNENIHVIPNGIDFNVWRKLKNKTKKGKIRIGWEGGSSHIEDVAILKSVIPAILRKYSNVEFVFLGGEIPMEIEKLKGVTAIHEWIPCTKYPAVKADLGFDIELAPLRDTQFNRGKSNLRWLEASALKIPTIASNCGPYKEITGLVCDTEEDWINSISVLIEDKKLRIALGEKAHKRAKKEFSSTNIARQYASILNLELEKHKRRQLDVSSTKHIL